MDKPYFSVITPTYNRADIIETTIQSVLSQDFANFEYIIVDDASTDNTESVVKSYKDLRIRYFKKENGERGAARNFGISKARGSYVCYLDSDDIYYENHLSEAKKFISDNNEIEFFYQPYEIQLGNKNKIRQKGFDNRQVIERISNNNFLCPIGAFTRTDVAKQQLFDEDPKFNIAEDLYVWLKIGIRYGIKFSSTYTSCLVHHAGRSMETLDPERLVYCTEKLVYLLNKDEEFSKHQNLISTVYASHLSLCALYFSIEGKKIKAIDFLVKSHLVSFKSIFRKRTLVTIKNILLKW